MTVEIGQPALISVATATLWTSPKATEDGDRLALGTRSAIRDWVAGMTREGRVTGLVDRTVSQALLGDEVIVDEIEDGWAKIIVPDQPSSLDERGYPGWVPLDQLSKIEGTMSGLPHIVSATATSIRDEPAGEVLIPGATLGTKLAVLDEEPYRGWARVALPGPQPPGWARLHDLSPAPESPTPGKSGRQEALQVASQLLDVPYVWGGMTGFGVDCSGLVYLAYRQLGIELPRDAHDQAEATALVEPELVKPGDLFFFARPGKSIHHVGIATEPGDNGDPAMIHAAGNYGKVVQETFTTERAETLVATRRAFKDE